MPGLDPNEAIITKLAAHEQAINCRQVFADHVHVVGSRPIEREKNIQRMRDFLCWCAVNTFSSQEVAILLVCARDRSRSQSPRSPRPAVGTRGTQVLGTRLAVRSIGVLDAPKGFGVYRTRIEIREYFENNLFCALSFKSF